MDAIISLREVTKRFRETVALDKVTVDFEAGKIHGIVGRNGSGKTVLMKCVCGLMHQDAGEILVRSQRVGKDVDIPQGIGAIIEAPGFLPNFSGYRNLKFLADIRRRVGKERVRWAMETVGLDPDSPKHVGKYSLGMRQRLGLAQAILEDPDLLIFRRAHERPGQTRRGGNASAAAGPAAGGEDHPPGQPQQRGHRPAVRHGPRNGRRPPAAVRGKAGQKRP